MPGDAYDPAAAAVLSGMPQPRPRPAGFIEGVPGDRTDLLLQALDYLPEGERADVRSLIEAGEWAEAAHQMRGGPGDREIAAEAHALIDRAMA